MLDVLRRLTILYRADAPLWVRSYVWAAEAILLDPLLYIVVAAVLLLEWRLPADSRQPRLSKGFWQDLFWFLGDRLMWVGALGALAHSARLFYHAYLSALTLDVVVSLPGVARIVLSLLVFDFFDWGRHYLKHRVWWLWTFHAVHHSQREMNLFSDLRVHSVEYLVAKSIMFVPLFMVPLKEPAIMAYSAATVWYTRLIHANVRTNLGPLRHILVTPQYHRIHHSMELRHRDRNFGVVFTVWDRIFGTMYPHFDEYPPTGVEGVDFSPLPRPSPAAWLASIWSQVAYPFRQLLLRKRAVWSAHASTSLTG